MKEYLEKIYRELDAVTHCKAADSATLENIENAKQSISRILADENNKIFAVPQSAAELEQKYLEKVPEEMQDVYIREAFAAYEAQGFRDNFKDVLKDVFGIDDGHDGSPFRVLRRAVPDDPYMELSVCKQYLPAWVIEFPDGERITAGPDEIVDMPEN